VTLATIVDRLIEAPVVTSFTKIGYQVRSRLDEWKPLDEYDLTGKTIVVTGATSGLGRNACESFARNGANVVIIGRDVDKTTRVRDQIADATGSDIVDFGLADIGDLGQVRRLAESLADRPHIDVLIHNAGALAGSRSVTNDGFESTVASQVLGPFLLTSMLLAQLRAAPIGRVLTMSSGGMYAAALTVSGLQMSDTDYRGSEQYARAKRAQVTLNEVWANRIPASDVVFHAVHPGWADTPGVEAALPRFRRIMRPLLRTPLQGADTMIWLASDNDEPLRCSGGFWLDRRPRSLHKLPATRRSDTDQRRAALWDWCVEHSGAEIS
jgi:dehydrogenase/reductase SDR family member 12